MDINNKTPAFQLSIDAQYLYNHIMKMKVGDVLTYEEMKNMLKKDVQTQYRYIISSARRKARRDGIEFGTVSKVGIKRLNDSEIVGTSHSIYERTRRAAKRGVMVLQNANFDKLPDEQKTEYNTNMTLCGVLSTITSAKNVEKLHKRIAEIKTTLPISRTLELFS